MSKVNSTSRATRFLRVIRAVRWLRVLRIDRFNRMVKLYRMLLLLGKFKKKLRNNKLLRLRIKLRKILSQIILL